MEVIMRKIVLALMMGLCMGMTGCASKLMQPIDHAAMNDTVQQYETGIVFFRATSFGGAVQAPIVEATEDGTLSFVAVVSAGKKYLHRTTPGKHLYVVGGESSDLLEANMEAGKTYYVYISPHIGWVKARFAFDPVKNVADGTFRKDLAWCDWVANTPEGAKWFTDNLPSLQTKYADAKKEHAEAKPEDRKVVKPEYGSLVPVK